MADRGCLVRSYSRCIIDAALSRLEDRTEGRTNGGSETVAVDRGWPFRESTSFMHVYRKPFQG